MWKPPEDRAALREAAGIGPDTFVIGCNMANNDAIRKALPEIMLAFARFLKDRPDSLLALHTGVHQDGGQDLECVAENLGITDRVKVVDQYRYTAGLISQQDLAGWYGTIDVLCGASYGEGFGLPIIEAQACGTPGDHDQVLEHGGTEPARHHSGRGAVLERRPPGVVGQAVGAGPVRGVHAGARGP